MQNKANENGKKPNKFASVLKIIFVHNIGWKLLSLFAAGVIWALAVGLTGLV